MKNVIFSALVPFASRYRALNLQARWWHRLAIVLLGALLILAFALTAGVSLLHAMNARRIAVADAYDALANQVREGRYEVDPNTGEAVQVKHDDLVKLAKESHPLNVPQIFGLAILTTFAVSYGLQLLYRVVIFIAYGGSAPAA